MRRDGSAPVTEYDSHSEAEHAAYCIAVHHGQTLTPYRCDRCDKHHLAPPREQRSARHRCFSCNKVSFDSEYEAQEAASHQRWRHSNHLRVYYSDRCGCFHLTSS